MMCVCVFVPGLCAFLRTSLDSSSHLTVGKDKRKMGQNSFMGQEISLSLESKFSSLADLPFVIGILTKENSAKCSAENIVENTP